MDSIDLYCERADAEFWAEPLNALSNLAFLLAAWAVWRSAGRTSALSPGIAWLIALTVAIGLGSFAFHTLATGWAQLLDVVPILIFQLLFLWLYLRQVPGLGRIPSALLVAAFLGLCLYSRQYSMLLNGSLGYAPALLVLAVLGFYQARTQDAARYGLLSAAGVLVLSLAFRTVDNAICAAWPLGTHFVWHLANGLVLYLAMLTLARQRVPRTAN